MTEHMHDCPQCGSTWSHMDDECEAFGNDKPWASCPECEHPSSNGTPGAFKEELMPEDCNCDRHHCRNYAACPDDDCTLPDCSRRICEECASDPACSGEDLNPGYAEDEHSFLGPKL